MANAIPPLGDLEAWEIDLAKVLVSIFLLEQEVFTRDDRDDLENESLLHWLEVRNRYSAERGASIQTYMRHVLRNKLSDLLAAETAAKRGGWVRPLSLHAPLDPSDAEGENRGDSVVDAGAGTEASARLLELQARLALVRSLLPPPAAELLDALLLDSNKAAAARRLGLSRAALYRRLQSILACAKEQGLDEFLD